MFARLVTFELSPDHAPVTEVLADEQAPIIRGLPGFVALHFLHDDARHRYGSFSIWNTREEAEAVGRVAALQVRDALKAGMRDRAKVEIFEIYKPAS